MIPASPLLTIYNSIQQARANVASNAGILQKNEAATRATLIDPILRALGWDTTNVRMMEPEFTVANKQTLDYLLKDVNGGVSIVVEGKKLGESLDKIGHVGALIGYAFSLKPLSFFLTDGMIWHCYSPAHSQFQPVETLNLQDANATEAALTLIRWLDAAQSGHGIQGTDLIQSFSPSTTPSAKASNATRKATVATPIKLNKVAAKSDFFKDVSQLDLSNLPSGEKPKQLRLPDGTIKSISTWKDILVEVCRLVLKTNQSLVIPFPDKAGKKTSLFTRQKPAKVSSTLETYNGQPVFIYTNYDKHHCIANALYALAQLPSSQKFFSLAVSF